MTGHVWVIQTNLTALLFIFKCQNHPRIERVSIYTLVSVTLLEHLSSPPVFCEVRFTRSLVLCACFVYICPFVLFHCVVCSSSIYGFRLPLWYLQALLTYYFMRVRTVWYINGNQNIQHRANCQKMKRIIYHTVRTVIKWKTKYTTPFELS
jgi:hypothetical protein